jgi:hypothetical protein
MMTTQIITGIDLVFEKSLLLQLLCHTVTLSHVTHTVVVVVVFCHTPEFSQRLFSELEHDVFCIFFTLLRFSFTIFERGVRKQQLIEQNV